MTFTEIFQLAYEYLPTPNFNQDILTKLVVFSMSLESQFQEYEKIPILRFNFIIANFMWHNYLLDKLKQP